MNIIPRTQWQDPALPVKGPAMVLSGIRLIPAHYTAMSVIPNDIPALLRAVQRDYMNRKPAGYSIGYNFAIDQKGLIYECRGFDIKCAANAGHNEETIAILCLVDGADPMNPAMVASFKELAFECQRRCNRELTVVCHCDIGSTACPGRGIISQVVNDLLDPSPWPPPSPTPPTPQEDDEMPFIIRNRATNQPAIVYGDGKVTGLAAADLAAYEARFGSAIPTAPEVFDDFASKQ